VTEGVATVPTQVGSRIVPILLIFLGRWQADLQQWCERYRYPSPMARSLAATGRQRGEAPNIAFGCQRNLAGGDSCYGHDVALLAVLITAAFAARILVLFGLMPRSSSSN
jgi:hypothetical protein